MNARQGLTLFEVVISLGIFLVSMAGLYQLLNFTNDRVSEIDLHTQASLYCQSKLAELTTGIITFESTDWTTMEEDPLWSYQVEVAPAEVDGLSSVRVAVKYGDADPPEMVVSLAQLMIDPKKRGSTLDQFGTTAAPSTTTESSSSSSSGGTTSTGASGTGAAGTGTTSTGGGGTSGTGTSTGGKQ